jgi:hypothetical protein
MIFSGKILTLLYFSLEEKLVRCTFREEALNQIRTKIFFRLGEGAKSGINLDDCQKYIPTKRNMLKVGKEITLPCGLTIIIHEVLRKTKKGYLCLVSYASSTVNYFLETIPF